MLHLHAHCWLFAGKFHGVGSSLPRSGTGAVPAAGAIESRSPLKREGQHENSGGNRASGGASLGTRLVVLGVAAGALGYAVVYFFDRSLGEERRRRVLEAAQAAMQEFVLLSQRLVAARAEPEPAPEPERGRAAEPVLERPRDYHEPVPAPEMPDTLHDKVTFFRLGDEEAEEAPVLAPVAVIAEELPGRSRTRHESRVRRRRRSRRRSSPTTPIRRPGRRPEPEQELPAAAEPRTGRTLLAAAAVVAVLAAAAALGAWAIWSGGDSKPAAAPAPAGAAQLGQPDQPARRAPPACRGLEGDDGPGHDAERPVPS